jgi:hypothetical protein
MSNAVIVIRDKMQARYRYRLSEPEGQNFDPEFRPELTAPELLRLGVFGGKYMTGCRNEFPLTRASPFRSGATTAGFIRTTPAAGFNGIDDRRQVKRWKAMRRHVRQI